MIQENKYTELSAIGIEREYYDTQEQYEQALEQSEEELQNYLHEKKTTKHIITPNKRDQEIIEKLSKEQLEKIKNKQNIIIKPTAKQEIEELTTYVIQLLLLNKKSDATEEIVKYIRKRNTILTTRYDEKPEMWIYREGIYVPEAKTYIEEINRIVLGVAYTSHISNNIIRKIMSESYIDPDKFFNQQNDYPEQIPVQNGLLNIKTKKLIPFTEKYIYFNKLSVKYNPKATCEVFKKFISEITKNEQDIKAIQELIGYCLLKEYRYETAFMFYGSNGRNGKSKLLSTIEALLGAENITNISLQEIEKSHFSLSDLHNKLVNISPEISKSAINNTGTFKQLTGRDRIAADRKHKTIIKFVNYAKMIFTSNELPPINTNSDAFWLRWLVIEFPHQFLSKKEYNILSDEEKKKSKIQDTEIINKLTTQEELEGLLVWALEGYQRLSKNRDFTNDRTANDVKKDWSMRSNSVLAFSEDNIMVDYDGYITKKDFRISYINFCKKNKIKPLSDKVIKITLENEFGANPNRKWITEGDEQNQYWIWDGISFRGDSNK